MLTKLRKKISSYVDKLAYSISRLGVSPNAITILGLVISFLCPLLAAYKISSPFLVAIGITISSFMDMLDGAIARVSKKITKFGSILDSFSDRIEESMYILSLMFLGLNEVMSILFLTFSFLISYLRALGEKHGIVVEGVGLVERGERVIIIIITVLIIGMDYLELAHIVIMMLILLCGITIIQRVMHIYKNIK